ncbi:hypothetical protein BDV93DRAFT_602101 [Ceratobasidium sp. AG-I]|nr:hypothetical protein BDV93DRAFT_602101 [Ceratobasidium sp. AG-I]
MSSSLAHEFICPSSLLPFSDHDEDILRLFALPVTNSMIRHVSVKLLAAVGVPGQQHLLPTPPVAPIRGNFAPSNLTCGPEWEFPPLEVFLTKLVLNSDVHTSSVLCSMIYLKRILRSLDSDGAKRGPETPYRLAVALFMIAGKYNLDVPLSNKIWTKCVAAALGIENICVSGCSSSPEGQGESRSSTSDECSMLGHTPPGYIFGPEAIAALERDVLYLLDYNLGFTEDELRDCLNPLSSHQRAEGPVEQLRMAKGWARKSLQGITKIAVAKHTTESMQRATITLTDPKVGQRQSKLYAMKPRRNPDPRMPSPPYTPKSNSFNPPNVFKSRGRFKSKPKPASELKMGAQGLPALPHPSNPWKCAPYPQLNSHMDADYLSKAIYDSRLQEPFAPIGIPPAPPSTPVAGIDSLPFMYGGKVHPTTSTPVSNMPGLVVAPDEDSPWAHGQVGEILRRTIAHQARQLAAMTSKPPRERTMLDTPPPVYALGSGFLHRDDPNSSTVERAPPSKLTVSDVRWYRALGQPIPPEMLEGELATEVQDALDGRQQVEVYDGMPVHGRTGRPVMPSSASMPAPAGHRAPHYQGVVVSGSVAGLKTCYDHEKQARWAAQWQEEYDGDYEEGYAEEGEEYETSTQKRVLTWRSTIPCSDGRERVSPLAKQGQWGVYVSTAPISLPQTPTKVGWIGKLMGKRS